MASFSVVNNIAAANAQAEPRHDQHRPEQGAEPPVERSPHQQLGRRRGRPGRGERLPVERRGAEPGHPQRQRRPVDPPDQGRRAQQHLDPARSSRDAGHAVGVGEQHRWTAPRWTPSSRTCCRKSTAKRRSPGSSTTATLLGVRQQRQHQRHDRRHGRSRPARRRSSLTGLVITSQATAQSAVAAVATAVTLLGGVAGAGRNDREPAASTPSAWRSRRS